MHTGWFAVDRQLLASDLWLTEKFSRGQAWVDLVGLARFKPGYVRLRGKRIDLAVGQIAWSQRQLAQRWQWSEKKVRTFLAELKSDGHIDYRSVGVTTVVTLLSCDSLTPNAAPQDAPTSAVASAVTIAPAAEPTHSPPSAPAPQPVPTKEPRQQSKQRQPPSEPTNGEGWGEILASLKKLGVAAAEPTIKAAQARGLSPDEVQTLVDEYRGQPGAWGLGALVGRLSGTLPQWPPPADDYLRQQSQRAYRTSLQRQERERSQRRAEFEKQRDAEAQLEAERGPQLDAMTPAEVAALEAQAIPDEAERTFSRQYPAVHRARLLAALDEPAASDAA